MAAVQTEPFPSTAPAPAARASAVPAAGGHRRRYRGARWLLERHLEHGDRVVLLSAGPQELVAAIASILGADVGVGTVAEVVDGRYTGRIDGPFCHGAGKLERLLGQVDRGDLVACTAYGDSESDLPVLRAAARAVAVNPDRPLALVARSSRWPIIRFS